MKYLFIDMVDETVEHEYVSRKRLKRWEHVFQN